MQRIHVIIGNQAHTRIVGDDIVVIDANVIIKGADDIADVRGPSTVLFTQDAMRTSGGGTGTDAKRMEYTIKAHAPINQIGFTVDAEWDKTQARWMVSTMVEILRDGVIPHQDPDKRLIAELKAEMARDGEVTIFPEQLDRLLAMIKKV